VQRLVDGLFEQLPRGGECLADQLGAGGEDDGFDGGVRVVLELGDHRPLDTSGGARNNTHDFIQTFPYDCLAPRFRRQPLASPHGRSTQCN
jgi:hypothetical protein